MPNHTAVDIPSESVSAYALFVRWVVTLHLLALAAQLASAISFVGGLAEAGLLHIYNARLVGVFGLWQAVVLVSLPASRLRRAHRWMAVGVLLAEGLQLYFRIAHGFAIHVTIAILVWAMSVALSIKVWAPTWKRGS
jgi:hypothetical protein